MASETTFKRRRNSGITLVPRRLIELDDSGYTIAPEPCTHSRLTERVHHVLHYDSANARERITTTRWTMCASCGERIEATASHEEHNGDE